MGKGLNVVKICYMKFSRYRSQENMHVCICESCKLISTEPQVLQGLGESGWRGFERMVLVQEFI